MVGNVRMNELADVHRVFGDGIPDDAVHVNLDGFVLDGAGDSRPPKEAQFAFGLVFLDQNRGADVASAFEANLGDVKSAVFRFIRTFHGSEVGEQQGRIVFHPLQTLGGGGGGKVPGSRRRWCGCLQLANGRFGGATVDDDYVPANVEQITGVVVNRVTPKPPSFWAKRRKS